MMTFTHEQVQEILRSGGEASGFEKERLTAHLSRCSACQSYAALVAELDQVVPRMVPVSLLSTQEIHRMVNASQTRLRRQSMLTLISRGTRTVIWLGATLALILIFFLLAPRLLPKQSNGNPTLTPLASVNSSQTPVLNATPKPGESIQYTVADGESLFSIAEKFGLNPETILWANPDVLADKPVNIKPGIVLRIPSVDGLYYRWNAGDTIEAVASRYGAASPDILNWPENTVQIGPAEKPNIQPGMLLFIPGGKMPLQPAPILPAASTPTPTRDAGGLELSALLKIFPLAPGARWVYTETTYTQTGDPNQIIRAVTSIEDHVADVQNLPPYYIAHIQREASLVSADPGWGDNGTKTSLGSSEFWYILHAGRVYQSNARPDPANLALDQLSEELDFPLTVGSAWCPNKIQKGSLTPEAETPVPCASVGARKVLGEESYTTQAGSFDHCFQLYDFYNTGGITHWFCDGVGVVAEKFDHAGSRFGYSKELVQYSVPSAVQPTANTPAPSIIGESQDPVLPDTSYVSTIVRAPLAWRKSTGLGVKVGVIQNHQEKLDLVNLIAPGAIVVPFMADTQFKIDGESPENVLSDQNIRLLVISQPGDFDPQILRQTVTALATANIAVFVNADLTPGDDQVALINDLEALGAITVGQLDGMGIARGRDLSRRKINLFAPCGLSVPTGNAALTAAGVGALILGDDPTLTAEAIKKRLVETADPMWQASDPLTGQWKYQNISIDPATGDYTPAGSAFHFKRINAANALGQTLAVPWPVNALNAPAAWKKATGKGVKVAVIDQGFHVDNPAFQGHLVDKAAFVKGKDFSGRQNFHGTSMAKIVLSVAPDASLIFLLLDETGSSATTLAEAKAIDYAIASGVDVITNSNGPWANTPEVHAAIDRAIDAGIVFVWFHYDGTNPAVIRPGYFWNSYYDVGAFDRFFDPDKPADLEGGLSDTSPQIAGIAALVLQKEPDLSPMEVKQRIVETAAMLPNECSLADAAAAVENRPSGIKLPEQNSALPAHGQIQIVYSLPGEVEKKTLTIVNSGMQTRLPVFPGRNVFLYRYNTNRPGDRPYKIIASNEDQLMIGLGFLHEGNLASGEAKFSDLDLILEKETRLRADLSAEGAQPVDLTVDGNNISLHWVSANGLPLMKMDNQSGEYSAPSGVILYQLDAEGDLLPLVNVFQAIY